MGGGGQWRTCAIEWDPRGTRYFNTLQRVADEYSVRVECVL